MYFKILYNCGNAFGTFKTIFIKLNSMSFTFRQSMFVLKVNKSHDVHRGIIELSSDKNIFLVNIKISDLHMNPNKCYKFE